MASKTSIPPIRLEEPCTRPTPKRHREDARYAGEPRPAVFRRVCAWCGLELARERWALSGDAEITTWGICPDCLELREGKGEVGASESAKGAIRRGDGPERKARDAGSSSSTSRAADVHTDPIG